MEITLLKEQKPPTLGYFKIKIEVPKGLYGSGVKEIKAYWNGTGFINFDTLMWNYYDYVVGWYDGAKA